MSPRGKKNTSTQPDTTAADGTATTTTTTEKKPPKAPRVVLEAKVEFIKQKLSDLLSPAFATVGDGEFTKAVQASKDAFEAALLLARGLADDWKPAIKRPRKTGIVQGGFVKTREKFLPLFKEKGLGAGPFKVLGVFATDKSVKLQTTEGVVVYLPQNQVEKVTTPEPAANG
jgi:hypothetical protein